MKRLTAAADRLGQARGLAQVLDTAYDAFEEILAVIGDHEDTTGIVAVPLLLAATQAANGRDTILFAPLCTVIQDEDVGVIGGEHAGTWFGPAG